MTKLTKSSLKRFGRRNNTFSTLLTTDFTPNLSDELDLPAPQAMCTYYH